MKIVQSPRASAILYHLITSQTKKHPWLLPANICPIVPITFLKAGIAYEFVDISSTTLNMDMDQAESLIKKRSYGGLLYAHTYGEESTPSDFFSHLKSTLPELLVIDDRCLCVPRLEFDPYNKADVQLYSTGYAKIAELNLGGYAFLDEQVNYKPCRLNFDLTHQDALEKAYKQAINQRKKFVYQDGDWLQTEAHVPPWQEYQKQIQIILDSSLEHRQRINQIYMQLLPVEIQLPERFQTWRFNIRLNQRNAIIQTIFTAGFFASSHYASLAGIFSDGHAPHAESLAGDVINLFNDHHFTTQQAEHICKIILENLS